MEMIGSALLVVFGIAFLAISMVMTRRKTKKKSLTDRALDVFVSSQASEGRFGRLFGK